MPPLIGVDTLHRVTQTLIDAATQMLGAPPPFWGRYFKRPGDGVYAKSAESPALHANGIKLLPIARQTRNVGGSRQLGGEDAAKNAAAFINAMGIEHLAAEGAEFLIFLDVEGDGPKNPSLAAEYYIGWSTELVAQSRKLSSGRFTLLPAVYARTLDSKTWKAIALATAAGAEPPRGAWVAFGIGRDEPNPSAFDAKKTTPPGGVPFPVMLWQFRLGEIFDLDMVNPDVAIGQALLERLVLPA